MPLAFNSDRQTTFYRNPISAGDLNSPVLVESREAIRLDNAGMIFQNWCLDGFRLAHSVLEQEQETAYNIKNDIDAIKIYFNRIGHTRINYRQLSKTFSMGNGQCNMLYSSELDSRMSHIDNHSEIFSLQITRECFLDLVGQGDGVLDEFAGKAARKQPALFADRWLSMNAAMDRCIGEILDCPFGENLKKIWLRSKALELFVLFAHSHSGSSGTKADIRARHARAANPSEIEKLHFVRDYLVQNYANPNSLQALTKISGLNEFKLKKGFRELFHTSVMDFLIDYRLERARELLLNSGKNISEVAYATGYASPAYFGKAFRRKYGSSPKDYSI